MLVIGVHAQAQPPRDLVTALVAAGAVVRTTRACVLDCASTAQVSRLFAYRWFPPETMLVTADVDAFPRSRHILDPLDEGERHELKVREFTTGF